MKWRIYYGDGSHYDSRDGSAFDAPGRNVQMIAGPDPDHGWYMWRSTDFYLYLEAEDRWIGADIFGLWDYLIEPGPKKVLFGRTISNADFQKILIHADNDPDIPKKTAWRPEERANAGMKEG
jgi:hypothetical protein